MSDDLIPWLLEQIAEDEQRARAATQGPWSRMGQRVLDPSPPSYRLGIGMAVGHAAADADYNETAEHIATWDPARVLAECEAKRRIVDLCRTETPETGGKPLAIRTLRLLALPYADRPGYREEWRP